ncbi:YtxH domain-containing protein [Niallia sp. Krafla_26]|uniref:YtxH domain-containing protein n=1 Tax=Niallia sp. Krafla_26 TaxID=3064703 RepID=UPI003D187258
MKGKSYIKGFLTGAFFSGLITLFLTPNSGKETRLKLRDTAESFIDQLSEVQSHLLQIQKDIASATIESKETIRTFMSDLETIIANWKKDISPHQVQLQKEIASLEETIEKIEASLRK